MPIPFKRYVDITSGIGAGANVARRDLICRMFTSSDKIDVNTIIEYRNADDVGKLFTTNSDEYRRAVFYFGFVSKQTTRPKLLSIARWDKDNQSISEVLTSTTEQSNNFGSFVFVDTLSEAQVIEAATWNATKNVMFIYNVPVLAADAESLSPKILTISGAGMTLKSDTEAEEYPEMLPSAIEASTDYTRRASVQNYMFYSASLTPTVTTSADADKYDKLRINYYGSTQTAGQIRRFYQRGVLTGNADISPADMNVYANEAWLKDDAGSRIMSLLLSQPRVPANQNGRGQVLNVIQASIDIALINGTISVSRMLSEVQKIYITEQTGNPDAWQQVQNSGYWLNAEIKTISTDDGRTEYTADYKLIYLKDDAIRKVDGSHTLI